MDRRVHGIGVSSGVAVGKVFLLHAEPLPVVPDPVPPERIDLEIERFHDARKAAGRELDELKSQVLEALGDPYAGIFEAQRMVLEDPSLVAQTVQRIRVGRVSARWALKEVVAEFVRKLNAVDDEYIRERGGELADIQRRLQRLLRGETGHVQPLPAGPLVVVAHAAGPSDALMLAREEVVGLATDAGGRTSHTAILAQALELPAVVGLHDFSRRVGAGETIVLDGTSGHVVVSPTPEELSEAEQQRQAGIVLETEMASSRDLPAISRDGIPIILRANIEFPAEVDRAIRFGAQGVGLYRSEFLFLSRSPELPSAEEHYETYVEIARSVAPHVAVIRTLDLGGEKYFHDVLQEDAPNPVLGLRAIRFCLKRPGIFRPQLRGLLRAAAEQSNLRVMLPLVTSPEEVWEVRKLMSEEAEALRAEGLPARGDVPLGVMIEVPAAAVAADILAREADFFSIGTNDLIQYALAVDRSNESLADLYQPMHPGVLRMVRMVVDAAERAGISVAVCGEMAADPQAVGLLIGLGLRELSVQPRAVARVRDLVRRLSVEQAEKLALEVLDRPTADEVERQLKPIL